ncbi:hypothetical protein KC939_01830 [Candidatus Saccharibacteria bacterium]|nr:hypothetical protein [Candidatus Saccharibacteria bacterium]
MSDTVGGGGPVGGEAVMALAESAEIHKQLVLSHTLFHNSRDIRSCGNCGEEVVHDEIQEACAKCNVPWVFVAVTHNFLELEEGAALFRGSPFIFIGEGSRAWGIDAPLLPAKP